MNRANLSIAIVLTWLCYFSSHFSTLHAQGTTAFTYQGQLKDNGTNANGTYTMMFKLYDSLTVGNQVGPSLTNTLALANGLFTVNLDFGQNIFTGNARYLDITISNGVVQNLAPRVQILPAPYALYSAVASSVPAGIGVTNAFVTNSTLSGDFITNSIFAGNGSGITNLNLMGTYTNPVTLSNPSNSFFGSFTGNGAGITNLLLTGLYTNTVTFSNPANLFVGGFSGSVTGALISPIFLPPASTACFTGVLSRRRPFPTSRPTHTIIPAA
jgi:hypothetical protein